MSLSRIVLAGFVLMMGAMGCGPNDRLPVDSVAVVREVPNPPNWPEQAGYARMLEEPGAIKGAPKLLRTGVHVKILEDHYPVEMKDDLKADSLGQCDRRPIKILVLNGVNARLIGEVCRAYLREFKN